MTNLKGDILGFSENSWANRISSKFFNPSMNTSSLSKYGWLFKVHHQTPRFTIQVSPLFQNILPVWGSGRGHFPAVHVLFICRAGEPYIAIIYYAELKTCVPPQAFLLRCCRRCKRPLFALSSLLTDCHYLLHKATEEKSHLISFPFFNLI